MGNTAEPVVTVQAAADGFTVSVEAGVYEVWMDEDECLGFVRGPAEKLFRAARGKHQVFVYGGGRIVWKDTVNVGAGQEPETDPAPQEPTESALSLDRLKALKALLVPLIQEIEKAIQTLKGDENA